MEACEVVRLFVNKAIVPAEPRRPGNPGYGRLKALRVLVFARLKGFENDTRVVEHLKKHRRRHEPLAYSECQTEQPLADGGDGTSAFWKILSGKYQTCFSSSSPQ